MRRSLLQRHYSGRFQERTEAAPFLVEELARPLWRTRYRAAFYMTLAGRLQVFNWATPFYAPRFLTLSKCCLLIRTADTANIVFATLRKPLD
jgi:hypothetical protein